MTYELHLGDCIATMRAMPDNSVDSIVTDPPYELGFMGKAWDASGIAYSVEMWREALRVLKPGGHLLAFSGSRTYHRMAVAIEDAGFDIRDQIMWVYGSGFPKSQNVAKAITGKEMGFGSNATAIRRATMGSEYEPSGVRGNRDGVARSSNTGMMGRDLPLSSTARQWDGWGTALKPAHEPICVARKPLAKGMTVAANVLQFGTGAINVDGCRVETSDNLNGGAYADEGGRIVSGAMGASGMNVPGKTAGVEFVQPVGRWPANLIHDGSDEVAALFPGQSSGSRAAGVRAGMGFHGADGDGGSAITGSSGSAARFFYCAKASRVDRNEGLASLGEAVVAKDATMRDCETADWSARNGNHHPTVKPTELMAYLARLVTPPCGLVLDPFMGSGSTGKACMREGFRFTGIDMTPEYVEIARARIAHELAEVTLANTPPPPAPQLDLFAMEKEVA